VSDPSPSGNLSSATGSPIVVSTLKAVYFYGEGCEHCEKVKPVIASLRQKYPDLQVEALEVYHNATNQQRFVDMNRQYNISSSGIPEIFIGTRALVGDVAISGQFEAAILAEKARIASCNTTEITPVPDGECATGAISLTPQMVILPALVDSINPCALSVLIFLLIPLAAAANRRRILSIGGAYIAAVFLFHLLVGVGIFSVVSLSGFSKIFSLIGGSLAIIFGIITLSDVIRKRETFFLSVPKSGKGLLSHYSRIASVPAAFILGILAGLLGFSCTGGIYISILALMSQSLTVAAGLPYLLLYNVIFILPLVLVTLLVAYGISPEKADTWRTEHKLALRLVIGLIMIALGLVIFLGWFG